MLVILVAAPPPPQDANYNDYNDNNNCCECETSAGRTFRASSLQLATESPPREAVGGTEVGGKVVLEHDRPQESRGNGSSRSARPRREQ